MSIDFVTSSLRAPGMGIWIETSDSLEAERFVQSVSHSNGFRVVQWNACDGLSSLALGNRYAGNPLQLLTMLASFPTLWHQSVLVLRDADSFLTDPALRTALRRAVEFGATHRMTVVVLASDCAIPEDLQHAFNVVCHTLPMRDELHGIQSPTIPLLEKDLIAHGLAGLTRSEARHALALVSALSSAQRLAGIWSYKAWHLERHSLLRFHRERATLDRLFGMSHLKHQGLIGTQPARSPARRGLLILGPPGSGKKTFCQALGNMAAQPVVSLCWERLLGLDAQELERQLRKSLQLVEALAPAIFVCETNARGLTDLGFWNAPLAGRLWGMLLRWLQHPKPGVSFIATGENPGQIPRELWQPAFLDATYFVDLPRGDDRERIWRTARTQFGLAQTDQILGTGGWSASEIYHCCRTAALLGVTVPESAGRMTPYAVLNAESLKRLRDAARGRALDAEDGTLYGGPPRQPHRRWIDPSLN